MQYGTFSGELIFENWFLRNVYLAPFLSKSASSNSKTSEILKSQPQVILYGTFSRELTFEKYLCCIVSFEIVHQHYRFLISQLSNKRAV